MKKPYQIAEKTIRYFFLALGIIGSLVVFHEAYHLLSIEGNPEGICLGKCHIGSEYGAYAPAAIHWDGPIPKYEKDPLNNELNAWLFSFILNLFLVSLMIILYNPKKE